MNSLCILVMKPYRIRFVPFEPNIDALSPMYLPGSLPEIEYIPITKL